jgi:hypothetical protein
MLMSIVRMYYNNQEGYMATLAYLEFAQAVIAEV